MPFEVSYLNCLVQPYKQFLAGKEILAPTAKPQLLSDLEEGIGTLQAVEDQDCFTLANFGTFSLLLPPELAPQLCKLVGLRVGILKIDGTYKLRVDRRLP